MHTLLGVLVAAIVAEPDVVAALHQLKGQASFLGRQAHPHLAIHHEAMVQVDNLLLLALCAVAGVDSHIFLAPFPAQAVQAQQIAVARLDDVLLAFVSVELAQLGKVGGIGNGAPDGFFLVTRALRRGRGAVVEEATGKAVAKVDNGGRQGEGDDGNEGLEDDEGDGQEQGNVLADVQAREKGNMQRHGDGGGSEVLGGWAERDETVMATGKPSVDCNANA